MPKISIVPTREVEKIAEDQGMLPERYIGGIEKTLIPYDLRYKDEHGKFLHDLKITRDDGSSFSIHEVESECEDLPKFVITDYTKKGAKRFYAYTHNIDLVRLQNDEKYLYAFSEVLCSKERINEKKHVSLENNNKEYIYLGGLKYDYSAQGYVKVAKRYKDIAEEIYSHKKGNIKKEFIPYDKYQNAKIEAKSSVQIRNENVANKEDKLEKHSLIYNITECLVNMDANELKDVAKKLGIK